MEDIVRSVKVVGENVTRRSTRDGFCVYGEHIANELRYLKDTKYHLILAETKQKINAALYEAEICRIKLDSY
jgi:aminoglycoside/choline kinase family phosphotransferase